MIKGISYIGYEWLMCTMEFIKWDEESLADEKLNLTEKQREKREENIRLRKMRMEKARRLDNDI